jgi:PAS domain S-box-containing protein
MEFERFTPLADALPGLVWTALPDGRAEFLNTRWCEYTGLRLDQGIGFGWHSAVHPEDLTLVLERWRSLVESGNPGEVQARLKRSDGEYRRFLISAAPIADKSGWVVKLCGFNTDIEDRLRAEEASSAPASAAELLRADTHLTQAQRLSRTGSFTWDVQADEHIWSAEIYRIFGLEPGTKVELPMIQSVIHPDDMPAVEAVIGGAAEGRDFDLFFRIVAPDGAVRHAHVVGHRSEEITDRPVFLGAIQDVTENKVAEEALIVARTELAHMSRVLTLGALAASIAHEVNQPIAAALTYAQTAIHLLRADRPDLDELKETLGLIVESNRRAGDVVGRIRTLVKKAPLQQLTLDVNDVIREVIALTRSEAIRNAVSLRTHFAEGLPSVIGDRIQVQQVILNLFLNAVEAMKGMEERTREVRITTEAPDDGGVLVAVRDSGPGIAPANLERVFDPFYTTKPQGMGIGLAICRSIIEAHGGRLWASPNETGGVTFQFTLPPSRTDSARSERADHLTTA